MNQEKIGSFIAQRRKDKKLTQAKLASYLGISDRTISKWERGKGLPDPMYMLELCQILDISVNELLTGEFIEERNYQQKAEDNLLMMANQEVKQTKKMFFYEEIRYGPMRIDKIENANLRRYEITHGDIILVSFSDNIDRCVV